MNKIILSGRIVTDIELKETSNGTEYCNIRLAVARKFKKDTDTDFISVVLWKGNAKFIADYTEKGKMILVDGTLQQKTYEAQDGTKRNIVEVIADNVEILEWKDSSSKEISNRKEDNINEKLEAPVSEPTIEPEFDPFADGNE